MTSFQGRLICTASHLYPSHLVYLIPNNTGLTVLAFQLVTQHQNTPLKPMWDSISKVYQIRLLNQQPTKRKNKIGVTEAHSSKSHITHTVVRGRGSNSCGRQEQGVVHANVGQKVTYLTPP